MMKTNMEYLKEFIKDNEEALEFWEAVQKEIKQKDVEIKSLNTVNDEKQEEIDSLEDSLKEADEEMLDELEVIDCVIGEIRYKNPDNMKLQSIMEDLKGKLEHKAKFGVLPETIEL